MKNKTTTTKNLEGTFQCVKFQVRPESTSIIQYYAGKVANAIK